MVNNATVATAVTHLNFSGNIFLKGEEKLS
jgi:hypothetical protein